MSQKVTLQDIADELGVSRNTVSKAINNTGILAEATREKVLKKAIEMGYKQFSYASSVSDIHDPASAINSNKPAGEIALLTGGLLGNSHFASTMLDKFQYEISLMGYSLSMHRVDSSIISKLSLPVTLNISNIKAIVCIEMFDSAYSQMLCQLGLPVLMIDAPVSSYWKPLGADILLMDNTSNIFTIINDLKKRNIRKIGFIGQATHCRSFFERFMAFREAMYINGMNLDERFCLTEIHAHGENYKGYLTTAIKKIDELPDLFICANDFVAMDTLGVFKELGISCPEDVKLIGFDDSMESKLITPTLSTCHIHSQVMGYSAANLIISRIKQPDLNYRIVYTETDLIYRESSK